jgi:hypothetical protein
LGQESDFGRSSCRGIQGSRSSGIHLKTEYKEGNDRPLPSFHELLAIIHIRLNILS